MPKNNQSKQLAELIAEAESDKLKVFAQTSMQETSVKALLEDIIPSKQKQEKTKKPQPSKGTKQRRRRSNRL